MKVTTIFVAALALTGSECREKKSTTHGLALDPTSSLFTRFKHKLEIRSKQAIRLGIRSMLITAAHHYIKRSGLLPTSVRNQNATMDQMDSSMSQSNSPMGQNNSSSPAMGQKNSTDSTPSSGRKATSDFTKNATASINNIDMNPNSSKNMTTNKNQGTKNSTTSKDASENDSQTSDPNDPSQDSSSTTPATTKVSQTNTTSNPFGTTDITDMTASAIKPGFIYVTSVLCIYYSYFL